MKITDLKVAIIGNAPIVRITTDEGIDGVGAAEYWKPYLKPMIEFYRDMIIGKDPTDVERVMLGIRRMGSFKPWGAAVSAIEMALWDIAGKSAGLPVYKLLGGKIRDRVQVYNGSVRYEMSGLEPENYAENMQKMKDHPYNFSIIKQAVSFHGGMQNVDGFYYGTPVKKMRHPNRGTITGKGFRYLMARIEAMLDVLGDDVGLALEGAPAANRVERRVREEQVGATDEVPVEQPLRLVQRKMPTIGAEALGGVSPALRHGRRAARRQARQEEDRHVRHGRGQGQGHDGPRAPICRVLGEGPSPHGLPRSGPRACGGSTPGLGQGPQGDHHAAGPSDGADLVSARRADGLHLAGVSRPHCDGHGRTSG